MRAPTSAGSNVQRARQRLLARYHNDALAEWMNGPVRKHVGLVPEGVTWGGQSARVFDALGADFMAPVIGVMDALLAAGAPLLSRPLLSVPMLLLAF